MSRPLGRILVADDEPDLLEAYAALLTDAGYEVATAENGRQALRLLGDGGFDLILSDIVMPDMDGVSLLRAVREHDLDVPVVLVTGSPRVETAAKAVEHGALRYLVKPVSEAELMQTVGQGMRLSRLARLKREALTHLGGDRLVGDRAGLEATFTRAVGSLWMAYQPIVHAAEGHLFGHEALVRTAERSLPHPGALFDAAERTGRLHELGRAIRVQVASSVGVTGGKGCLFVNLHPQDLLDPALFALGSPLTAHARNVILEVTERASLEGIDDLPRRIRSLRSLGYRIAVDDLGAGYAGLTSFAALEPDVVKLDMALVRGADQEPVKRKLIQSITTLCKELAILVVAEGVETEAERRTMVELGCDLLQGFLLGRPEARSEAGSPGSRLGERA